MNLVQAECMANKIVRQYAPGWTVTWGTARSQFGLCMYEPRRIHLSRPLTQLNTQATFEWVVLHEVAHVLAGPKAGHGRLFKVHTLSLGIVGDRCWTKGGNTDVVQIEGQYRGECELGCGFSTTMHKMSYSAYTRGICPTCSNRRTRLWVHLDWTRDGQPVAKPRKPAPRRRTRRY